MAASINVAFSTHLKSVSMKHMANTVAYPDYNNLEEGWVQHTGEIIDMSTCQLVCCEYFGCLPAHLNITQTLQLSWKGCQFNV